MKQSTRLVLNASISYLRMVLTVGIGLAIVRLLFRALGEDGYGLFTALVASGAFLGIISTSLIASTQRHIAFALGRNDLSVQRREFRAAQFLFIWLGVVICLVGVATLPLVIKVLTIPNGYESNARWAFLLSILNIALTTLVSPFLATIQAHQDILFSSLIELAERIALLSLVFLLEWSPIDPIVTYAACIAGVTVLRGVMCIAFASWRYPEVSILPRWVGWKTTIPHMTYAGITLASNIGVTARDQGSLVMLNAFFGPAVNAAYSLSQQLTGYLVRLASTIVTVINPAATTTEGRGDAHTSQRYANVGSRYSFFAASLLAVPILLDTEMLIELWLGKPAPAFSVAFVWLTIIMRLIGIMSWGDNIAAQAKGRIGGISIIQSVPGGVALLAVGYIYYDSGTNAGPLLLPLVMVGVTISVSMFMNPILVGRMLDRPWKIFLKQVPLKIAITLFPALGCSVAVRFTSPELAWRPLLVCFVFSVVLILCIGLYGMELWERQAWKEMVSKIHRRTTPPDSNVV